MRKRFIKDNEFPDEDEFVLVHLTITNWGPSRGQYYRVVKFNKGITEDERENLPDSKRKKTYISADVFGNNLVPYYWDEHGPGGYFGQDVDYWYRLSDL